MNRLVFFILIIFSPTLSFAQPRPIGTWKAFFPYQIVNQVEDAGDRVYCAATMSIFYVEKSDNSVHTVDKASGLSDVNVKKIKYNSSLKTLVITYENSNIDLLVNGETLFNIPDIKNKNSGSSKNINDIFTSGNFAYLATDIGIAVVDLIKREIKATYVIGSNGGNVVVNGVAINGGKIFAATNEGIKIAALANPNLQDYNVWTTQKNGLIPQKTSFIGLAQNTVFAAMKDSIFRFNGSGWNFLYYQPSSVIKSFKASDSKLYVCLWIDTSGRFDRNILAFDDAGNFSKSDFNRAFRPMDIIKGETTWIADKWSGLLQYSSVNADPEDETPNGPVSNGVFNMAIHDNVVYLAAGGTDPTYSDYHNNRDGLVYYKDYTWRTYNPKYYGQIGNCADYLSVAYNDVTNKVYYASFQCGISELDLNTGNLLNYDNTNSLIQPVAGSSIFRVTAVCTDKYGNTWMSNANTLRQLVLLKPDGTWKSFSVPYNIISTRKMIEVEGKIWMCNRAGNIVVYDPGDNVDDESDDKYISLGTGTGNGGLPNNSVWSMVEDKNGDVWVGTEEGIGTFFCASNVFSTSACDADRIKVDRDGFIGYLFSTEIVKAIAVDGANRKWVGTGNGVWLISADGKTELLRFTIDNSPLPSNFVTDIKVNQQTGEVFIGTENGLVGYQGDAILGGEKKGEVLVYPNPVQPTYMGSIAIKGLVDDAYVKITDASGILVFQGKANGGQMIWDGKGYKGERVKSGVYFVYAATDLGKEKSVAKIVMLN